MIEDIILPPLNLKKTVNEIEKFIKESVKNSNTDGLIIGLSGGIDSALVAFLAQRAIGSENILGITLPTKTTSRNDIDDAKK